MAENRSRSREVRAQAVFSPASPAVTGAILAGGVSRRLGRDKTALRLAGKPLVLWVAEVLAPVVSELWLVTNHLEAHLPFGLPMVSDLRPFQGPLGGLCTALFFARTPWVLAAATDNPFLSPELVAALAGRASKTARPAVVCRSSQGLEPFPGLYSVRLLTPLAGYLKTERHLIRFVERSAPEVLPEDEVRRWDPGERSFFNLNTMADWREAERWLAAAAD